jgi:hypothetical protein
LIKKNVLSNWGSFNITSDEIIQKKFGDLKILIKKAGDEIWIASKHLDTGETATHEELPQQTDWNRWAITEDNPTIVFSPIFPNRPVVVKPEHVFKVEHGNKVRIYIKIPIWVEIKQTGKTSNRLIELPTVILSNTWFGNFLDGELCYWISSSIHRIIQPDLSKPYLAICSIKIINEAKEDLLVEKTRLAVENLSIFESNGQLYGDETVVYYKGSKDVTQIEVNHKPPKEAGSARLISPPRSPIKKSFTAKTFSTLKDLPGLGVLTN